MPLDTPIPWNQKMIRHGEWWLDLQNMLQGEFLHPREHEKLIFTDTSNAGWGGHLNQESTGGLWSQHEKHLHINLLKLKAVFLALQFFKKNCINNLVLIASDNTSVVSYINKQGGRKSAALCVLMWRILTWCHNKVTLRARHVPGSLSVIVDGLSRRNQIQSTVVPLSTDFQENFQSLGESPGGPLCNQPEQQIPSLHLSNSRSSGMGSGCPEHPIGKPCCIRFSSHCPSAQDDTETPVSNLQDNLNRPRLAYETVVLGSSGDVSGHTQTTTTHSHPTQTTTEKPFPCQPNFPEPPRLNTGSMQRWQKELLLLKHSQQGSSILPSGQSFKDGAQRNRWTSGIPL